MKMIVYTDHAKDRMATRLIKKAWVVEAIMRPDQVMDVKYGRKQATKKVNGEEISVVYAQEADTVVVITVFWGK